MKVVIVTKHLSNDNNGNITARRIKKNKKEKTVRRITMKKREDFPRRTTGAGHPSFRIMTI